MCSTPAGVKAAGEEEHVSSRAHVHIAGCSNICGAGNGGERRSYNCRWNVIPHCLVSSYLLMIGSPLIFSLYS